ncbi:MAG: HD domain-containing protein [Acidimicrobiia bacterium]|nr:HD domain-containing protein [Acidimicrobiia bacterium]
MTGTRGSSTGELVPTSRIRRTAVIAALLLLVSAVHFVTPVESLLFHGVHVVMRKLFVLPVVLGAAWFQLRGAVIAATVATLLFSMHAAVQWHGHTPENINQAGEVISIWIVAIFAGVLFTRARRLSDALVATHHGTVLALVAALDVREHDTQVHSRRVQAFALAIAGELRLGRLNTRSLSLGALLHDVGKIGVPDSVLLKRGPLDDGEWTMMRRHPEVGRRILAGVPFLERAVHVVYAHHERFDGSGYPQGLSGERIPITARVFAVADVFDALISARPYKEAIPVDDARRIILANSGSHFDPTVVAAFERICPDRWRAIIDRIETDEALPFERVHDDDRTAHGHQAPTDV